MCLRPQVCCLILLLLILVCTAEVQAESPEKVRPPVWAGRFYPDDPAKLVGMIEQLTLKAQETPLSLPAGKALRALIMPHAGYVYSGWTAAHTGRLLGAGQFARVLVLAPDHRVGFQNGMISDVFAYQTPLGRIPLDEDAGRLRDQIALFGTSPASDRLEHSLEVVLPFLQHYLKAFTLIPVVLGPGDAGAMAGALNPFIDPGTLLVVSSDLSHYLPYAEATARDRQTVELIMNLNADGLAARENCACGKQPIMVALRLARRHGWQPVLLHYSNSGDTAGDRSQVVGYAAIAFYGDPPMETNPQKSDYFNSQQGLKLVKLARCTLMRELGQAVDSADLKTLDEALSKGPFDRRCGTFVTLKIDGRLRGCIGNLTASHPVSEGVRRNALNAAFHDPRFAPLSAAELDQVEVEVSILSQPQPLKYKNSADLAGKLRPNVDGVIISKGSASATFLPQVWEQLPLPEDFLSHLCMKAGLSSDAWEKSKLDVRTYQVQYFEED